ncbi:DUF1636 domain-containing protein [Gluconobacter sp. Dm-62]|uniref:DUF1636 family protein n=1 Tax=Gluconobacter sp. Dm-62 TaxID=2799804 RepID=UPI001B8D6920|nr:DUF1636 domain-containing protein [Gluconobacter sp. Dm-62]MBS1101681.1 DUF1636 domain-containing protein [Gluconobacter sp. Dm-62]
MSDTTSSTTPTEPAVQPVLTVCVTCRRGLSSAEIGDAPGPGRQLYDALLANAEESGILIRPVECMSLCSRGCTATVSMPGKWTLLLGGLEMEKIADFKGWLKLYSASKTGMVPASKRPPTLSDMVIARLPADIASPAKPA